MGALMRDTIRAAAEASITARKARDENADVHARIARGGRPAPAKGTPGALRNNMADRVVEDMIVPAPHGDEDA